MIFLEKIMENQNSNITKVQFMCNFRSTAFTHVKESMENINVKSVFTEKKLLASEKPIA